MIKSLRGENDNYLYHSANELTLSQQIESAQKALSSVIRLSQTDKNDYWGKKKTEIESRIQQLEKQ